MKMDTVYILWTGGWDSTYRVVELSRLCVIIQPVYILDESRHSYERELKSIDTITRLLMDKEETLASFLPLIIVNKTDIPENKHISDTVTMLREKYQWGVQHDWISRIALEYPGIELCVEKIVGEFSPTRNIINAHGSVTMGTHGYIVTDDSDEVLKTVLGNITLPIFETTETQMVENIKSWGYESIMENIWFCHNPINGKPCGLCVPCHTKWDNGMRFLLPADAIRRANRVEAINRKYGKKGAGRYKRLARKIKVI
jgi:7-cyano-7-deazaguanine synthase